MQNNNPFSISNWENERQNWLSRRGEKNIKLKLNKNNELGLIENGINEIRTGFSEIILKKAELGKEKIKEGMKSIIKGLELLEKSLNQKFSEENSKELHLIHKAVEDVCKGLEEIETCLHGPFCDALHVSQGLHNLEEGFHKLEKNLSNL